MPGFDRDFYLAHNPDVAASGTDPLAHYLKHGWREGREPSAGFSGRRYLALNPDVQAADVNPLVHYLDCGLAEGRVGAGHPPAALTPEPLPPAPAPTKEPSPRSNEPTRLL